MKKKSGFTLMELMTAIAIVAILTAIATPNVIRWLNNSKFNAAAREVHEFIQDARIKALKENTSMNVEFDNANNQYRLTYLNRSTQNTITKPWQQLPPGITMNANVATVTMNPRGMANMGTITIVGPGGNNLQVTVNITGSSRISG